jgi:hypothetical protein
MAIKFQTNVPIELRLRSIDGRPVDSQFGGVQHMFSAEEGAFYVSEVVGDILARKLRDLQVSPGDLVKITKAEVSRGNGRKGIEWQVALVVGQQPNGTLAVPKEPPTEMEQKLADSIALVEQRKQAKQTAAAAPAWADAIVAQTNCLVDAYSKVLLHASQYPNVRSEDIRSIFLSTFINATKGASRNAA